MYIIFGNFNPNPNNEPPLKALVKLVEKEKAYIKEGKSLAEQYETAENLKNESEMARIAAEACKLTENVSNLIAEKLLISTLVIKENREFRHN